MRKVLAQVWTIAGTVLLGAAQVLANEPKGEGAPDYSGISAMYYSLIALILAYGLYDTFLKKN